MSRDKFFFLPEGALPTFGRDEKLDKLPLPTLEETLARYQRNLLPFGSEVELANSQKIINEFKNGVGKKLHKLLEEKAATERNWVSAEVRSTFIIAGQIPNSKMTCRLSDTGKTWPITA